MQINAQEYTPESPEVRSMIEKGVHYLESRQNSPYSVGYQVLFGYAIFMATESVDHPVVQKALDETKKIANAPEGSDFENSDDYVYAVGVSLQLMVAVDPNKYMPEMLKLLEYLKVRQRPDGAWGHKYKQAYMHVGDTSQTQYALLGIWALDQAQVNYPAEMSERAFNWLASTQFPTGGFAHRAPSLEYTPNHHMTAAGMSSVMIAADLLRALRPGGSSAMVNLEEKGADDSVVPFALRRVFIDPTGRTKSQVTPAAVKSIVLKADRWMASTPYQREFGTTWHYYMLYSVERYRAFLEAMVGKREKSPDWYNGMVMELQQNQAVNGAWSDIDSDAGSLEANTAFAILVLLRATQKSIGELSEAVQFGGVGLASDMSSASIEVGRVQDNAEISDVDHALALLTDATAKGVNVDALSRRITLDSDPTVRHDQLLRFARMLQGGDPVSRRLAAKILCRGDDLDMVPYLIYALSDPDGQTNIYAENSLRVLSRQLDTYKIPVELQADQRSFPMEVRGAAQKYWKDWYLTIRPDFSFLDGE